MKKFIKITAVLLLLGVVLSSCSNSDDVNYAMGRFDQMNENSTYFARNIANIQALANSSNDKTMKLSIKNQIANFQREHQKHITETDNLLKTLKSNAISCGGAWVTVVITVFFCVLIFILLLAMGKIKIN